MNPSDLHPRSPQWSLVRRRWLQSNGSCAACGGRVHLEVHHIKPFHLFPQWELTSSNFLTLCESEHKCHLIIGHFGCWRAINPDSVRDAAEHLALVRSGGLVGVAV